MNRFIKNNRNSLASVSVLLIWMLSLGVSNVLAQPDNNQTVKSDEAPRFIHGEIIYADIDSTNNRLYVVLSDGLWQYGLRSEKWKYISVLEELPDDFFEFEFAYNADKKVLNFWDRGVGRVFEADPKTYGIERVDQSHSHKNQFKHQPFIRDGNIYAFGGYGYWIWKNYITYYDRELQEWSVQNISSDSQVPSARVPHAGAYSSSSDNFLIYGGKVPSEQHRADDQYTPSRNINDIWSFTFGDNSWKKITELEQSEKFYDPSSLARIERINGISSSAFSNNSNVWYIPTSTKDTSDDLVFLTPVNAVTGQVGSAILLPAIEANQIVPTNFLFNSSSGNLIIVGIKKVTDRNAYPIKIIRVSEDSLLSELAFRATEENGRWVYILILILLAGLSGAFYWKNRSKQTNDSQRLKAQLTYEDIQQMQSLKSDEKLLLKYLFDNQGYLESRNIDEVVWPDIDNYDYRRKLRNDTINSINKKFRKRLPVGADVIKRIKDPDDKRRYLYGLNKDVMD